MSLVGSDTLVSKTELVLITESLDVKVADFGLARVVSDERATTLTQEQFNAELAARGANPLPASLYDGRPVMRAALPSQPMTLTTELADVISPGGNSTLKLGTLTWTNLNAGGTVLWIWGH